MKISWKAATTLEERSNRCYYVEKFATHVLLYFLKKIRSFISAKLYINI